MLVPELATGDLVDLYRLMKFDLLALLRWRRMVGVMGAMTASIRILWLVRLSIFHRELIFTRTLMGGYEPYDATTVTLRVNDCVMYDPRRVIKKTFVSPRITAGTPFPRECAASKER